VQLDRETEFVRKNGLNLWKANFDVLEWRRRRGNKHDRARKFLAKIFFTFSVFTISVFTISVFTISVFTISVLFLEKLLEWRQAIRWEESELIDEKKRLRFRESFHELRENVSMKQKNLIFPNYFLFIWVKTKFLRIHQRKRDIGLEQRALNE
jgi:hypothetical protein